MKIVDDVQKVILDSRGNSPKKFFLDYCKGLVSRMSQSTIQFPTSIYTEILQLVRNLLSGKIAVSHANDEMELIKRRIEKIMDGHEYKNSKNV